MFLRKVAVKNFGPFEGEHTLDLFSQCKVEDRRPVVLIGGLNGSGKSSLLEAVRLCLHGRRALGNPRNVGLSRAPKEANPPEQRWQAVCYFFSSLGNRDC